jgi:hypothetical protein
MPNDPKQLAPETDAALGYEPSEAEIEQWAARERERREAWLRGPTQSQKAIWAERERERRMAESQGRALSQQGPGADPTRIAQHYLREMQLAAEGAVSLMFKFSLRDMMDNLVRAGREWEDEYTSRPTQRRRVALEPESPAADVRSTQGSPSSSITPEKP